MSGVLRPYTRRSRVTLDWALVAVGLMACAVLAGLLIRTDGLGQAAQFGTRIGGLRALSGTQTLVVFEDMSSGGGSGWSHGQRDAALPGLGAVWRADPPTDTLSRNIALPMDTVRAVLSLDLIAIDDWAGNGLEVRIGDTPVLVHRFGIRPDTPAPATPRSPDLISVRAAPLQDIDGPARSAQRLAVEIAVTTPGDTLTLTIAQVPAEGEEAGDSAPPWAIDNLIVVAERLP